MKKLLSAILALCMLCTMFSFSAFAASEYVRDADMEGVDYTLAEGSWVLTYNPNAADTSALAATEMTSAAGNYNVGSKQSAAVYKVSLPQVPAGKEIDTAEFRMTSYYSSARAMPYAYKMPGDDWDMSSITIADAQALIDGNNLGTGDNYLGACKEDATLYASTTDYRNRYDVAEYINECIKNGQDYAWIAVTRHNTIKAYRHNYSGCEAKLYYTVRDSLGFTATSSTPEEGATAVYPIGTAKVNYSDNVAFAQATINDTPVAEDEIVISGNTVSINYDLGLSETVTLTVTATDASGNSDIYEVTFTTDSKYQFWDDSDMVGIDYTLADGSWILSYDPAATDTTALAATEMANTSANYNVGNKKNAAVYRVALPQVPKGKEIDMAEFRMSTWYSTPRVMPYAYKMTGDDWDMSTITVADAQKLINGNSLGTGDNLLATCTHDESYANVSNYRNKYTVSQYVADAIANGQEYVWIAVTYSGTIKAYRHDYEEQKAMLYYTLKDVGALSVESSTPAEGATAVYPVGKASVVFSNQIASATATINGEAVAAENIKISEKTVDVSFNLGLNAETALAVTVTDINDQTLTHTINFTTDSKYRFYDDSDMAGIDYTLADGSWILSYDPAAEDTSALAATEMTNSSANYNVGNKKNAAVYRVALPQVPKGKEIDMAEFRMSSYYSTSQARVMPYAYKMKGDDWDMSTITIADAQALINGNSLGTGDNLLATCVYEDSYANPADYRNKYSVSDYVAQAVANGQEYVWIAVTYSGTIKAYRHNYEGREARLYYTLKEAGVLSVEGTTPAEGATEVYPIGKASVAFTNLITSATATINGEAVDAQNIEIVGKTVEVSFYLGLDEEIALSVTATDTNDQTITHTISFTTDSKYKFYDDSDMAGIAYTIGEGSWVMSYDAAAEDTTALAATPIPSASNINVGNGINAAVYKMKLPEVPEGKRIKMAEFRVSAWYTSRRFMNELYKMPGEAWDMSTITIADGQGIINNNNLITTCSSDKSYFDGTSVNRCKYDVTRYINECIRNGQEYVYIAASHYYTIKAYAHDSGMNGAKLYFTLEDQPEEELIIAQPKIVEAANDAEYPIAVDTVVKPGKDIKVISDMTNTTANDVELKVAIAQYIGNKLVSVVYTNYTLESGCEYETIELGAMTIEADVNKVKAFIWTSNLSAKTLAKEISSMQ